MVWLLLTTLAAAGNVAAAESKDRHPLTDILGQVERFLQQDLAEDGVMINVYPLDSRIFLKRCQAPLSIDYQRNRRRSGKVVTEVRCTGENPWRVYVSAKVYQVKKVAVATTTLMEGERIEPSHISYEARDLSRLRHGYFEDIAQLEGYLAKKMIQADTVLTPRLVYVPNLINKGDRVSILIRSGPLRVQMKGVAMENGHRDSRIRVKNSSSGKVVEGLVTAPAQVVVDQ